MFGLIGGSDTRFFKTEKPNVGEYEALGKVLFTYSRGEKKSSTGCHAVPAEILDDTEALTAWAKKS